MQGVGVLEFVHQQMAESRAVMLLDGRIVAAQLKGTQQQFGEIHQTGAVASGLVGAVYAHQRALAEVAVGGKIFRSASFFLLAVDEPGDDFGRPLVFRQFQRFQNAFDKTRLVVSVEDLEVLRQLRVLPVHA